MIALIKLEDAPSLRGCKNRLKRISSLTAKKISRSTKSHKIFP
jgi:hypothetical protein